MIWAILCLVLGMATSLISLVYHNPASESGFVWALVSFVLLAASIMLLGL